MENSYWNKRRIITTSIGVAFLLVLVISAAFSYFAVNGSNSALSSTIIGAIGGDTIGTVSLSGGDDTLYLGITPYDMSKVNIGTSYYSSTAEGSKETNAESAGKTTYTATLSGATTDTVTYACDYEFSITGTGTMMEKESKGDIQVVVEGDHTETISLGSSSTISGTWGGIKYSSPTRTLSAYLKLDNTSESQNDLVGTSLSLTITNVKFDCYVEEYNELAGEAYALYTASNNTLTFVRSETPIIAGQTHNEVLITDVYTGFETESYASDTVPWSSQLNNIYTVVFEDKIKPISTAWWFNGISMGSSGKSDLSNLDTSLVTNMSYMFYASNFGNLDLSSWDVANVTDMSFMFSHFNYWYEEESVLTLNDWDVSNVTNMSHMFDSLSIELGNNISVLGIENWDVSNVTDMIRMFQYNSTIANELDLSNWNVTKVIYYYDFYKEEYNNIIPPTWKNFQFAIYSDTDNSLRIYNKSEMPTLGSEYNHRLVSAVYNFSIDSKPVSCTSVTPETIIAEDIVIAPYNLDFWFTECTKVYYIDLTKLDVRNSNFMNSMFNNVGSDDTVTEFAILGLENWDTSQVTEMKKMFYNMGKNATYTLDLSNWDVSRMYLERMYTDFNYGVETKVIAPNWKK